MLADAEHRPWPLPAGPWVQAQTWEDLLFAHWRVSEDALRDHVPLRLELDTFDGSVWLGVTPFRVAGLRLRGLPPLPALSSFPELNVRTYVTRDRKPGIWFFSLDADSRLAVEGAKATYRLPYFRAHMSAARRAGWIEYESHRAGGDAVFVARYRGEGDFFRPEPGSLEHFLTERYCLYAAEGERVFRADIHHPPWPLQRAEAEIAENTMCPAGVELPDDAPLLFVAGRQDVVIWPLEELEG